MSRSLDGGGAVMFLPRPVVSASAQNDCTSYVVWQSDAAPGYYLNDVNVNATAADTWEVAITGNPQVYRFSNIIVCNPRGLNETVTLNARNYPRAPVDAMIHYIIDYGYTITGGTTIRAGVAGNGTRHCVLTSTVVNGIETLSFEFYAVYSVTVDRANWNIDRLDGTGPSKVNIMSRTQSPDGSARAWKLIVTQSRGLLGSTRIGFIVDDSILYAHEFSVFRGALNPSDFINFVARAVYAPYYSITQTANAVTPKSYIVHASVIADGPLMQVAPSHVHCHSTGSSTVNSGTSGIFHPLASLRTADGPADYNKFMAPTRLSIINNGATPVAFRMILNGTLTGSSFANVDAAVSAAAIDTSATALTDGRIVTGGHIASGESHIFDFMNDCYHRPIGTTVMRSANELYTLVATTASSTPCPVSFTLTWAEFH